MSGKETHLAIPSNPHTAFNHRPTPPCKGNHSSLMFVAIHCTVLLIALLAADP